MKWINYHIIPLTTVSSTNDDTSNTTSSLHRVTQGPEILSGLFVKIHVNQQIFYYMVSVWLAAVLSANQMPGLKTNMDVYMKIS